MGIGYRGGLPWTNGLKSDMGFFRRVTMRSGGGDRVGEERGGGEKGTICARNAVVMGRKTWESIPRKFRPLAGRVNVVVTRSAEKFRDEMKNAGGEGKEVVIVSSLTEGLRVLRELRQRDDDDAPAAREEQDEGSDFVIGGSEIYTAALQLSPSTSSAIHADRGDRREAKAQVQGVILRILQTQVRRTDGKAFECDTFFPLDLPKGSSGMGTAPGWRQADKAETESWVGEEVPQKEADWTRDAGGECEIRVVGWERMS